MSCSVCLGYDSYNCPCCGEKHTTTCPDCQGSGYTPYLAFDIRTRRDIPVTKAAYDLLSIDEDAAHTLGMRYCKQEIEICPTCYGSGEVQID